MGRVKPLTEEVSTVNEERHFKEKINKTVLGRDWDIQSINMEEMKEQIQKLKNERKEPIFEGKHESNFNVEIKYIKIMFREYTFSGNFK